MDNEENKSHKSEAKTKDYVYQVGFGNHFATEALDGALPPNQNNPQKCAYGLYAEQLSGTAFTCPRSNNERTWLYRIRPSVLHTPFRELEGSMYEDALSPCDQINPNQMRWKPMPLLPVSSSSEGNISDEKKLMFFQGLKVMCGAGEPNTKDGLRIYTYVFNQSMNNHQHAMVNSDGDFLIVPQTGTLIVWTEMGNLLVEPNEIIVIPRGIKYSIGCYDGIESCRGYILEIFKGHFKLPNLGPIGANGLANPRDFKYPTASFQDKDGPEDKWTIVNKWGGKFFQCGMEHCPYDVVAWHGNYAPYKYDLRLFCTMNSVSFDHPDPSIYTVLTCPTDEEGVAVADFVIFPPRWMVMEKSFRPPYYHRNVMSEYMGMIAGSYDAKKGFIPGASSLHNCMTPHGPDAPTFDHASNADLSPQYFNGGMAFMFETTYQLQLSAYANHDPIIADPEYYKCWSNLPKLFDAKQTVTNPPKTSI